MSPAASAGPRPQDDGLGDAAPRRARARAGSLGERSSAPGPAGSRCAPARSSRSSQPRNPRVEVIVPVRAEDHRVEAVERRRDRSRRGRPRWRRGRSSAAATSRRSRSQILSGTLSGRQVTKQIQVTRAGSRDAPAARATAVEQNWSDAGAASSSRSARMSRGSLGPPRPPPGSPLDGIEHQRGARSSRARVSASVGSPASRRTRSDAGRRAQPRDPRQLRRARFRLGRQSPVTAPGRGGSAGRGSRRRRARSALAARSVEPAGTARWSASSRAMNAAAFPCSGGAPRGRPLEPAAIA